MDYFNSISVLGAYIRGSTQSSDIRIEGSHSATPAITISRQAGARGRSMGRLLREKFQSKNTADTVPWTLFDQELISEFLKQENLPSSLEQFLPEDQISTVDATVGEIVGLHPSLWELREKFDRNIYNLCRLGHTIIVGRGANIITRTLPNMIHLRLIDSLQNRITYMTNYLKVEEAKAKDYVLKTDAARKRYLKVNFNCDIDAPELYDLTINTGRIGNSEMVALVENLIEERNHMTGKKV